MARKQQPRRGKNQSKKSSADAGDNRRQNTRADVAVEVRVMSESTPLVSGKAQDLSIGGVFVPCRGGPPVGTPCQIALIQAGDPAPWLVELDGKVARSEKKGIGITFTEMDAECYEHVRDLVLAHVDQTTDAAAAKVRMEYRRRVGSAS